MSRLIEVNQSTLLTLKLYDGDTAQFPQARLYNAAGTEQAGLGSPFNLSHVAVGIYTGTFTPTLEGEYYISYVVFSDAGRTILNRKYTQIAEMISCRSIDADLATLISRLTAGRANNLDNLDATVSSRLSTATFNTITGTPVTSVSADIAAIQTKLGTPSIAATIAASQTLIYNRIGAPVGASISADIAAVQTSSNNIFSRIGAPVGASISVDIAAVQTTSNNIFSRIGAPVGASISADIAAVNTKLGTPVGASVSADIASVKTDTNGLRTDYTTVRAARLDNLDVVLSTRLAGSVFTSTIGTPVTSVSADIAAVQTKLGTPVGASVSVDIASNLTAINNVNTKLGTPVGASVSIDIASVKSDTNGLRTDYTTVRAGLLDNLDVVLSTRLSTSDFNTAIGTPVSSVSADIAGIQTKLGTPVGASVSIDIASVKSDTNGLRTDYTTVRAGRLDNLDVVLSTRLSTSAFNTAIGTPVASVSADIAGIQTKLGTPVGASVSIDIAGIQTKLGTPVGASVSADIASVKSDSSGLRTDYTTVRAARLDNLDVVLSTRLSTSSFNTAIGTPVTSVSADIAAVQTKLGTPVTSVSADIASVKSDTSGLRTDYTTVRAARLDNLDVVLSTRLSTSSFNTVIGTPVTSVSADIAAVQTKLGTPSGASVSADIASVKTDTDGLRTDYTTLRAANLDNLDESVASRLSTVDFDTKIGTPVVTVSDDLASIKIDTSNIDFQTQVGSIESAVWDALVSSHSTAGTFGEALQVDVSSPELIATAVWGALQADNLVAGSFGAALQGDLDVVLSTRLSSSDFATVIGTPNLSVSEDIDAIQDKLGTPAGASVSADIADVKSDTATAVSQTTDAAIGIGVWDSLKSAHLVSGSFGASFQGNIDVVLSTRLSASAFSTTIGTPVGASISADIAAIQSKLGTPSGASVSADIAAVKSDTNTTVNQTTAVAIASSVWDAIAASYNNAGSFGEALQTDVASPTTIATAVWGALQSANTVSGSFGAALQGNLDVVLSTRASQTSLNNLSATIGTPNTATIAGDISAVKSDTNTINNKLGTPAGVSVSADIAAVKSTADNGFLAVQNKLGTPAGASVSADIASVKSDTNGLRIDYTTVRAAKLDLLDAAITTRATPAQVSSSVWGVNQTSFVTAGTFGAAFQGSILGSISVGRADNLDNLDTAVSTRLSTSSFNTVIGTPVNASVTADIAALKLDLDTRVGNPAGASVSADILQIRNAQLSLSAAFSAVIGTPATGTISGDLASIESGVDSLNLKLTTGRANNLDRIDDTITSRASQSSVDGLSSNSNFVTVIPPTIIIPVSGSQNNVIIAQAYDSSGTPIDPDLNLISMEVKDSVGAVVQASVNMTRTGLGNYEANFVSFSTDPTRTLYFFFAYEIASVPFSSVRVTEQSSSAGDIETLLNRLTQPRADNLDNLDATVSSRATLTGQQTFAALLGTPTGPTFASDFAAIKSDTGTLISRLTTLRANNLDFLNAPISSLATNAQAAAIKLQTDKITFQGSLVRTISILVADKIDYGLSLAERSAIEDKIWNATASNHQLAGTFGLNLNSQISLLATHADILAIQGPMWNSTTDNLKEIRDAISSGLSLVPVLNELDVIKGTGFAAGVSDLASLAVLGGATQSSANAAAANALDAKNAALSNATSLQASSISSAVALIPTNPLLANDPRSFFLDASVSSRATASVLSQIAGTGFNTATDSLRQISLRTSSFVFGDATLANQQSILSSVSQLASQVSVNALGSAVSAIPTNPLLTNDLRLANLDAAISSMATNSDMQLIKGAGFGTSTSSLAVIASLIVGANLDLAPVLAELAKIEGLGFRDQTDNLNIANVTNKQDLAGIKADTSALLSTGQPF